MVTHQPRKGQSLVEAMIALSVFTVGFLGILTLLAQSFFLNRATTDQTKATYLAEEGVELAKSFIDYYDVYSTLPVGSAWGISCFDSIPGERTTGIELDYTMQNCASIRGYNPGDFLLYNPTSHFYGYTGGGGAVPTNFTRQIKIAENGEEITVDSIVYWKTGPITTQSLILEDHFYNWHP